MAQMKAAAPGKDFYPTSDSPDRIYALGGSGNEAAAVGNMSIDLMFSGDPSVQTVLMSSSSGAPYWSGV